MNQQLHQGGLMSAMRRVGNAIAQFRFEIDGKIHSGEELADHFDRKKREETRSGSGTTPDNHAERRKAGLDAFRQEDFAGAVRVFQPLAEETGLRKDWFNLFSAQLHRKDLNQALGALRSMRAVPPPISCDDCLSPAEEQFHVARLLSALGHGDLAAHELIALAECYQTSADDTFLHVRRVPLFGNVLGIMGALKQHMPEGDYLAFVDAFSAKVCAEAKEQIRENQRT